MVMANDEWKPIADAPIGVWILIQTNLSTLAVAQSPTKKGDFLLPGGGKYYRSNILFYQELPEPRAVQ